MPSTFLREAVGRRPSTSSKVQPAKEVYITLDPYTSPDSGGISFLAREEVEVIEKSDSGWWWCTLGKKVFIKLFALICSKGI